VQRGEFAILPKHIRAQTALLGGADLVLELPTPWASATAECFALGGAAILQASGVVTHLAFSCESGNIDELRLLSGAMDHPEYSLALRRHLFQGVTFAVARERAAEEVLGISASALSAPNNALAVEYLRALKALGANMDVIALPRVGAAHDSGELVEYSSASAIRRQILEGGQWCELLPEGTAALMRREIRSGRGPMTMKTCERAVLARLRAMDEESFALYDGGGEGLYHRFYTAVQTNSRVEDILFAAKTKRYPLARLRRMLLHSYLGVPQAKKDQLPPYLRILGANERGRGLLRRMRGSAALPLITQPGQVRRMDDRVQALFDQEARCTDLYVLACPDLSRAVPGSEYTQNPIML